MTEAKHVQNSINTNKHGHIGDIPVSYESESAVSDVNVTGHNEMILHDTASSGIYNINKRTESDASRDHLGQLTAPLYIDSTLSIDMRRKQPMVEVRYPV